ncbi:hypothetical protein AWB76_01354 [Caballeronia temeraria]|uniref:Glycosyltransferase RgtA/B/C/D-like domain-containing protein n=1 Tax=Caballeronia temeraria TaxID=1777137 RepID=A0A157ZVX8_9BURK|nr:hypothetical protein [Caballeronia temeraria]SAK49616.1 hypothetical protein AWB76_01354 [Caballeronia temeraria]
MDITYRQTAPATLTLALCIAVMLPLFWLAYLYAVPTEDAVILFEYARNLAQTGVISYGHSGIPVEGATDFLWMLVIAGLKKAGVPEFLSALALNFAGALIILSQLKDSARRIIALIGLLFTPYLYAALQGFSPLLFCAVYVLCIVTSLRPYASFYALVLLLCLIRPDGVVWGAGLVLLRFVEGRGRHELGKELRNFLLYLCLPGLIYFAWRAWYFSELLPLPFLVKSAGDRNLILFYGYSGLYVLSAFAPIIPACLMSEDRVRLLRRLAWYFFLPCVFYSWMRLEQNAGNRFLAPMFFGTLFMLSRETKLRPMVVFTILSVLCGIKITVQTAETVAESRSEAYYYVSQDLARLNGKMLVTEAGRLAYHTNWITHDAWGLNTPQYAHKLIDYAQIDAGSYDLIDAHCKFSFLTNPIPLAANPPRSWDNLCHAMIDYVTDKQYKVFLVPLLTNGIACSNSRLCAFSSDASTRRPGCQRFDIFALSPSYAHFEEVSRLLKNRGAIDYSPTLKFEGDEICS